MKKNINIDKLQKDSDESKECVNNTLKPHKKEKFGFFR